MKTRLLVSVIASLPSIVGCGRDAAENRLEFTEGKDLGMKVTYDRQASLVLVSFAKELADGQALFVNARRGDLRSSEYQALDCAQVSGSAAKPLTDDALLGSSLHATHGDRTVFAIPLEDESLLIPPYSDSNLPAGQSWAHGDLTAEKQAILDVGVDVFVDVCVTASDATVLREQVDLFLALDLSKPNLVRDAMALDQSGPGAGQGADDFDHDSARASSAQKYGELCVAALGEIPFFANKREVGTDPVTGRPQFAYDTFDCRDAVHIPMTVTTADGSGNESVTAPIWDESEGGGDKACDKRQYIYPLCEQGPRVISAKNEEGTHWVLLCRKGRGKTPELVQTGVDDKGNPVFEDSTAYKDLSTHYNDIAMLGHNPITGRTCFFQNALYSKHDGAHVSHPADTEKSADIWSGVHGAQGGINCNNCHDSDPFILSPWISGAKRGESYRYAHLDPAGSKPGTPVVPMMGVHPDMAMRDPSTPYTLVNYVAQGWKHERQLVGEEVKGCNQCHRIGAGNTMRKWAVRTVGGDTGYASMLTDAYKTNWRRSHFMPFDPNPNNPDPLPPEDQWEGSPFAKAIEHIVACQGGASASSGSCTFADIPHEGTDLGGGGQCFSDIPDDCDY
jgi:hypothetical protein